MTREEFIEKAKSIHGDKYNYDKVDNIKSSNSIVVITCPKHGDFEQPVKVHLKGHGCRKCRDEANSIREKYDTEIFIEKSKEKYGDKFTYEKTNYQGSDKKVTITCKIHGDFDVVATEHLQGHGCTTCDRIKHRKEREEKLLNKFITKAKEIHGNKYNYSESVYKDSGTRIKIICPTHGPFYMPPLKHLYGRGCQECAKNVRRKTLEQFINDAQKVHGNTYDYSKSKYVNKNTDIEIICPKHGSFWMTPDNHIHGKQGCPQCRKSKLETEIEQWLIKNNIKFIYQCRQKYFPWLKKQSLDFYLPEYNTAIECQGRQHFEMASFGGKNETMEALKHRKELDENKLNLCTEHGIKLLYYADKQYNDEIITDKQQLIEEITK